MIEAILAHADTILILLFGVAVTSWDMLFLMVIRLRRRRYTVNVLGVDFVSHALSIFGYLVALRLLEATGDRSVSGTGSGVRAVYPVILLESTFLLGAVYMFFRERSRQVSMGTEETNQYELDLSPHTWAREGKSTFSWNGARQSIPHTKHTTIHSLIEKTRENL